jgi:hypothetical protein
MLRISNEYCVTRGATRPAESGVGVLLGAGVSDGVGTVVLVGMGTGVWVGMGTEVPVGVGPGVSMGMGVLVAWIVIVNRETPARPTRNRPIQPASTTAANTRARRVLRFFISRSVIPMQKKRPSAALGAEISALPG